MSHHSTTFQAVAGKKAAGVPSVSRRDLESTLGHILAVDIFHGDTVIPRTRIVILLLAL